MQLLLIALCTFAGVFAGRLSDSLNGFGKQRTKLQGRVKDSLSKFNGIKNNRTDEDLIYVRDKLKTRGNRFKSQYKLSKEQNLLLQEKLKKVGHFARLTKGDKLEEINAVADTDGELFEGDILLTKEQIDELDGGEGRVKRQAYKDSSYPKMLWSGSIPYTFDSSISAKARSIIEKGLAFWEANTCISFKLNGAGNNSLRFFAGNGCYSYVGRIAQWPQQEISIGSGCETIRTVTHEVGHALGFFHVQSRVDRDDYVTINMANVKEGMEHNFDKETAETNYNYGLPYDLGSVMQYGPYSFAKDTEVPTVLPKEGEFLYTMGSGKGPAFYDVLMMNKHYNCLGVCDNSKTVCYNGGYKDIKDCSKCKCPSGYGGNDCSQRTPGCGSTVVAKADYTVLTSQLVGDGQMSPVDDFSECTYWITAPAGKKIEVVLTNVGYVCAEGCYYGGVEIKAQADQKLTGYRYCCQEHKGKTLTSAGNALPIIVFNRYYYTMFTIKYKYV